MRGCDHCEGPVPWREALVAGENDEEPRRYCSNKCLYRGETGA